MYVTVLIVIVVSVWLLVAWLIRKGQDEYSLYASKLAGINALSLDEAKDRAENLLRDEMFFKCLESGAVNEEIFSSFPVGLRQIMQRYKVIESVSGPEVRLDRRLIGDSVNHPGYTVIGIGMEGSDTEFEISVSPPGEAIYECYQGESIDATFGTYTSIFHWIIATAGEAGAK